VIAGKTWREIRVMALVYLVMLEVLLVPVILLWPDFYSDLRRALPGIFKVADFGITIGNAISNRDEDVAYRGWIALMLFFRSVNLCGIAASVLLGTALFARERENQTLEFLLARPVSRGRLLWSKTWPTALCVTVPIFLANGSALLWSRQIDADLPLGPLALASLHGALFVLCFLAFTTWVSVLCRVQAHVAFWVGGLTVLEIGVYLIPRFRRTSLFRLSDFDWYGPIMAGNTGPREMFDPLHHRGLTTWLLLAIALFYALALRALQKLEP
jgi:ABC-type transport system involved in multi-copper enzyme maturation permease subunit